MAADLIPGPLRLIVHGLICHRFILLFFVIFLFSLNFFSRVQSPWGLDAIPLQHYTYNPPKPPTYIRSRAPTCSSASIGPGVLLLPPVGLKDRRSPLRVYKLVVHSTECQQHELVALRIHIVQGERILAQPCESLLGCRSVDILDDSGQLLVYYR